MRAPETAQMIKNVHASLNMMVSLFERSSWWKTTDGWNTKGALENIQDIILSLDPWMDGCMYEYARKKGIKPKPKVQMQINPTSLHIKTPSTPTLTSTRANPYKTTPTPQKNIPNKGTVKQAASEKKAGAPTQAFGHSEEWVTSKTQALELFNKFPHCEDAFDPKVATKEGIQVSKGWINKSYCDIDGEIFVSYLVYEYFSSFLTNIYVIPTGRRNQGNKLA